jgi:iron complex transport system ATP-binding protein
MLMADSVNASGIGFRYGTRWIFRNLDFRIASGELMAILGPNGCGKSTLMSVLSGATPPEEGKVDLYNNKLSVVPQSLVPSLPFTGLDMVLLGRARRISLFSSPGEEDYRVARKALERTKATHLVNRAFNTLSGGEKQLILIARALATECSVMLLDEPTAALDWHHQAHVLGLLKELANEGLAVVFSTHSPQHALDFADNVMLMVEPELQITGEPNTVLSEEALSRLFMLSVRRIQSADGDFSAAIPIFRSILN